MQRAARKRATNGHSLRCVSAVPAVALHPGKPQAAHEPATGACLAGRKALTRPRKLNLVTAQVAVPSVGSGAARCAWSIAPPGWRSASCCRCRCWCRCRISFTIAGWSGAYLSLDVLHRQWGMGGRRMGSCASGGRGRQDAVRAAPAQRSAGQPLSKCAGWQAGPACVAALRDSTSRARPRSGGCAAPSSPAA